MNPKVEAAIYKAFEEQFARSYCNERNAEFKARVWNASKRAGLKALTKEMLFRALEIMAESRNG